MPVGRSPCRWHRQCSLRGRLLLAHFLQTGVYFRLRLQQLLLRLQEPLYLLRLLALFLFFAHCVLVLVCRLPPLPHALLLVRARCVQRWQQYPLHPLYRSSSHRMCVPRRKGSVLYHTLPFRAGHALRCRMI